MGAEKGEQQDGKSLFPDPFLLKLFVKLI